MRMVERKEIIWAFISHSSSGEKEEFAPHL